MELDSRIRYRYKKRISQLLLRIFHLRFHGFLGIVNEAEPTIPRIIEELHFVPSGYLNRYLDDGGHYLASMVKCGGRPFDGRIISGGHVGGSKGYISELWLKALDFARVIDQAKIAFMTAVTPESVNCRTGVRAVLEHLNLDYYNLLEDDQLNSGTAVDLRYMLK